eukprot:TRINITY_DN11443_c0_g1_i3.p1 TRINITY_DN11443_c0_g1~~TRINITY_DN11443_c0_g1_i3.p1  ORF type:complete len:575 (+),score=113.21 TRINITY_DN11443_c0_g1_i3:119-1843(+)
MDCSRFIDVDRRVVEELLCPVCGMVPICEDEPLQLPCQHLFCRACIEQALARKGECPLDRIPCAVEDLQTSRPISNVIARLKITCDYCEEGCPERLEVVSLAAHVEQCSYAPTQCEHCGESVARRGLASHEDQCEKRPITCGLYPCEHVVAVDQLELHRDSDECAGKKVSCPDGCGEVVARGLLSTHHEVCPRASIPCRNAGFGCLWTGGRLQYDQHMEQCWFENSSDFLTSYQAEMGKLRAEVQQMQRTNDERVAKLECKVEEQAGTIVSLQSQLDVNKESAKALQEQTSAGFIYSLGGHNGHNYLNSVERYDRITNTWQQVAPMSAKRYCMVAAVLGGYVYALGGYDGSNYLPTCERYCSTSNTWTQVCPMNVKREWAAVVVLNGCIYAIGGYDGQHDLATMEKYDPVYNFWETCASMQTSRSYLAAAVYQGYIFVIGGYDGTNYLPTCERYDPMENRWEAVSSMCTKRSAVAAVVLNGGIYAIGGYDGSSRLASVERYNPVFDQWEIVTAMQHKRGNLAAAVLNNQVYVVGGYDGHTYHSSVERYDPVTDSWCTVEPMCIRRRGVAVAVAG